MYPFYRNGCTVLSPEGPGRRSTVRHRQWLPVNPKNDRKMVLPNLRYEPHGVSMRCCYSIVPISSQFYHSIDTLSFSLSLSFSIYIYIHTYIHIFYIYTYIHIYIYIYIYIYVYIYIYRHIYSIYIYIHMSLYLSISPSSVALFTHLYTWIHPFYGYLPRTISGSGRSVPQEALLRETGETERSLVGSSLHGGAKKVGGISPIHKW